MFVFPKTSYVYYAGESEEKSLSSSNSIEGSIESLLRESTNSGDEEDVINPDENTEEDVNDEEIEDEEDNYEEAVEADSKELKGIKLVSPIRKSLFPNRDSVLRFLHEGETGMETHKKIVPFFY